ncbi:hypothetical protein D3C76_1087070 [compost metagenome]
MCFFTVCQLDNLITLASLYRFANLIFFQLECSILYSFFLLTTAKEISVATLILSHSIKGFTLSQLSKISSSLELSNDILGFLFGRYKNYRSTHLLWSIKRIFIAIKGLFDLFVSYLNLRFKQLGQLQVEINIFDQIILRHAIGFQRLVQIFFGTK